MTLTLDPHGEQLLVAHLRSGGYRSPQEVVIRALETLAEKEPPVEPARTMTPAGRWRIFVKCVGVSRSVVSGSRN